MEYMIGAAVGAAVGALGTVVGFDREKSFYPTVMIIIAAYYVLFAAMGGSGQTLVAETAAASFFLILALVGYKRNLWIVTGAIAGHGVFDLVHHRFIENPSMPTWWPGFCSAADVVIGAWFAVRLMTSSQAPLTPE